MVTTLDESALQAVESALRQLFRWGNNPRFKERFAARAGVSLDRASYALITPLEVEPLRISEVAQRSGVDVSTASRQIVQLEGEGVVRRIPDPADGRAAVLELTARGRRHLKMITKARQEILAEVLGDFSDADMAGLAKLLARLNSSLSRYVEGDS